MSHTKEYLNKTEKYEFVACDLHCTSLLIHLSSNFWVLCYSVMSQPWLTAQHTPSCSLTCHCHHHSSLGQRGRKLDKKAHELRKIQGNVFLIIITGNTESWGGGVGKNNLLSISNDFSSEDQKANTKSSTFPPPPQTQLHLNNPTSFAPSPEAQVGWRWGWWSTHNRFSLPLLFPHTFFPLQHESFTIAAALQDQCALQSMGSPWVLHGFSMGCREHLLWSFEPPSWILIHPLLFPTWFCSLLPSPPCVIYPFLNVFPRQHHWISTSSPGGLSSAHWVCCRSLWNWLWQALASPYSHPTT